MRSYRKYDWPELLKEFEQSGLTQAQFCQDKGINPRYFCLKRAKLRKQQENQFTPVEIESTSFNGLVLEVGRCRVNCPTTMTLDSLAALVHTLA